MLIAPGGTILIAKGVYDENLVIKKSLTLRGKGTDPKDVRIVGAKGRYPVIRIESDSEIEVTIEKLTAAEAKGDTRAESLVTQQVFHGVKIAFCCRLRL